MKRISFGSLKKADQHLLRAAKQAMEEAYNPYSHFFVGAAVKTVEGAVITGSNLENASYALTICAERAAIARAFSSGHKVFRQIAIIGRGAKGPMKDVISPCGMCRQMMFECAQLADCSIQVILASTDMRKIILTTTKELLPLGFGPHTLGVNVDRFKITPVLGKS